MLNIISVTNPVYMDAGNTMIDCDVVWNDNGTTHPEEVFTASLYDDTPHAVLLWNNLVSGVYGDITPYNETPAMLEDAKLVRIDYLISRCESDIVSGITSSATGTGNTYNYDTRMVDQENWKHAEAYAELNTSPDVSDPSLPQVNHAWIKCNDPTGSLGYVKRAHSVAHIKLLRRDFYIHKMYKTDHLTNKINMINACTTLSAIEGVDW